MAKDTDAHTRVGGQSAPLVPNAETIKAMKAVRRGEMTTVHSTRKLFESLDAGDDRRNEK